LTISNGKADYNVLLDNIIEEDADTFTFKFIHSPIGEQAVWLATELKATDYREAIEQLDKHKDYVVHGTATFTNAVGIAAASKDSARNNGGKTDYYDLPKEAEDIQDLIEHKSMSWNIANIFKACYRLGSQDHSSAERDLNKMMYFIQRQIDLIQKDK
jgi:hypothetical protein